jgi:hypothetical protein
MCLANVRYDGSDRYPVIIFRKTILIINSAVINYNRAIIHTRVRYHIHRDNRDFRTELHTESRTRRV